MILYPPYDVHFYKNEVTDFHICSPLFEKLEDALSYAATHYLDCKYVRIGSWTDLKYPNKYYVLTDIDSQVMLF